MTMTLVQTITVDASSPASITFSAIPQTGQDLYLVFSARTNNSSFTSSRMYFNGNTTGYSARALRGDGASATSTTESYFIGEIPGASQTANTFGSLEAYIPNYTSAANKSYSTNAVSETNATTSYQVITAGTWANTAAITSLTLTNASAQYSTASLYTISTTGATGATVA